MSTAAFIALTLAIVAIGWFIESTQRDARKEDLTRELRRHGLEISEVKVWSTGGKHNRHFRFEFEARRADDPVTYLGSGLFEKHGSVPIIGWHGEDPRRVAAPALAARPLHAPDAEMSAEQRINMEMAARLDRITGTPGAMLEHDLDGSGHIDSQEWDALRAKIRAEVEAERGLGLAPPRPPPSGEAAAAEDAAVAEEEKAAATEEEEVEPSGVAW